MIQQMRIGQYLEKLSSATATPGGGAVAAFTLAQAAALVSMTCAYTLDRDKYISVQAQVRGIKNYALRIQEKAMEATDEDSRAYEQVLAAYKLPAQSPAEIEAKETQIQQTLEAAALVPWQLLELCEGFLEKTLELRPICNPNLKSDIDVSICLLQAAGESLWINVEVNLKSMKNISYCEKRRAQAAKIITKIRSVTPDPIGNLLTNPQ